MSEIIDLRETAPNRWQAKYQGNYGVYTVKIATDGKRRGDFSCSCPSDYYPCKHIAIVERAIAERIAKTAGNRNDREGGKLDVEDLLKRLTHEELFNFTARLIKYNPELTSAVFLEFSEKIGNEKGNKYVAIIREALADIDPGERDYYDENEFNIDVLDQWAEKAEQYLADKKPQEAVLIARAYIEEFAYWLQETADDDLADWIPETCQSRPFEILEKAAADSPVNAKDIYDYCMSEMARERYSGLSMTDCFNGLLMTLSKEIDPEAFIELQLRLLGQVQDKSSYGAEKILNRIIDFYRSCNQSEKAWNYIEENIQIDRFRREVVEKRIEQKKFSEAKKLISNYIDGEQNRYRSDIWDEFLLQIAQAENDIPAIRGVSFSFIKDHFKETYYRIYKSAFSTGEWPEKFEELFQHYTAQKGFWGDNSGADLLAAEGMAERLMGYIEKKLSMENIEKYHRFFAAAFPEKTLALFRKAIDHYAENNTGRTCYERIVSVFNVMEKIPGGGAVTADMKAQYLVRYKNRRAMTEILNRK
ncbi:MAG: metal ABC transporter substrate-binding protein [Spirochaetaceae bacterium]|jgi:hypothetical protein|nr:metal ABC transporter substrate-binding protein [Spirochaetaceae bacterium]